MKDDPNVRHAAQVNIFNTLRLALLLLPKRFTEVELFEKIALFSYFGDFRMRLGAERKGKVKNIVEAQSEFFRQMYDGAMNDFPSLVYVADSVLEQDVSLDSRSFHIARLSNNVKSRLFHLLLKDSFASSVDYHRLTAIAKDDQLCARELAQSPHLLLYIRKTLHDIVYTPSIQQALKGIVSTGICKSSIYAKRKIVGGIKNQ